MESCNWTKGHSLDGLALDTQGHTMGMNKLSAVGGPNGALNSKPPTPSAPAQVPTQVPMQTPTQVPTQVPMQTPTQATPRAAGIWPPAWGFRAGALDGQSKLSGPAWKSQWAGMVAMYQPPAGTDHAGAVAFLKDRVQLDHPRRGRV